ncbi:MAG: hypothetical protein AAFY91_09410 [Bacteroidota bacterium]
MKYILMRPLKFIVLLLVLWVGTVNLFGQEVPSRSSFDFSLIYPYDESIIQENRPMLSWENLSLIRLGQGRIAYDLILVELFEGQSPIEAINRNIPLVQEFGIPTNRLLYPALAKDLEPNKKYAWQVQATQEGFAVAISSAWVFELKTNLAAKSATANQSYVMVRTQPSPRFHIFDQDIYLAFDNNEGVSTLDYKIVDLTQDNTELTGLPTVTNLVAGLNTISIPTSGISLNSTSVYQIEIFTERGQVYYLRFMNPPSS